MLRDGRHGYPLVLELVSASETTCEEAFRRTKSRVASLKATTRLTLERAIISQPTGCFSEVACKICTLHCVDRSPVDFRAIQKRDDRKVFPRLMHR